MIPPDVASRLQLTADAAVPRVPTAQQVSNALADLVPGQRVLAEIQTLLPNGAYRALINQRDVTLSLPFSAKAGDSLELEVVDTDGQLALALVSRRTAKSEGSSGERPAVETFVSRAGSFIASLLPRKEQGEQAPPALLNANRPISPQPPTQAADLVPLLKQAIAQSGMFYEAHQSQWVGNARSIEDLLMQPQGRLSTPQAPGQGSGAPPPLQPQVDSPASARPETQAAPQQTAAAGEMQTQARPGMPPGAPVAPELLPLVQQQLEALATQTYVWQGQAWPGQTMQWEIVEEDGGRQAEGEDSPWQTRLALTMPLLGEVRAALRLTNGEIVLSLTTTSAEAAMQLANGGDGLRQQLEAAGLSLGGFTVGRHESTTE